MRGSVHPQPPISAANGKADLVHLGAVGARPVARQRPMTAPLWKAPSYLVAFPRQCQTVARKGPYGEAMTESARILLVEDEPTLATQIAAGLRREAWVVDHVGCLSDAIEALLTASFRLILLDRRLPDGDGLALVKVAKSRPSPPAIIFLTARDQIEDRVEGLDAGAEDYLVKPFALNELLARVRAACRRQPQGMADHRITVGRLAFVPTTREVEIAGRPIRLPRRELLLLELLAARAGRVVQRDRLDAEIYGFETNVSSNALETHVSRLRRRLVDLEAGATIVTVRGVGYMLRPL